MANLLYTFEMLSDNGIELSTLDFTKHIISNVMYGTTRNVKYKYIL